MKWKADKRKREEKKTWFYWILQKETTKWVDTREDRSVVGCVAVLFPIRLASVSWRKYHWNVICKRLTAKCFSSEAKSMWSHFLSCDIWGFERLKASEFEKWIGTSDFVLAIDNRNCWWNQAWTHLKLSLFLFYYELELKIDLEENFMRKIFYVGKIKQYQW